jgi:Protein of unknown function (DUF2934)
VINPKLNVRSNSAHASPRNSDAAIAAVQSRAYELYELRGKTDGRAEQDWYQAETDLKFGSKQA